MYKAPVPDEDSITWRTCSITIRASLNRCDSNPCLNGGTCYQYSRRNHACYCKRPYFGYNCAKVSPCISGKPCQNGGSCHISAYYPGFYCRCPLTNTGKQCEKENPCLEGKNPCHNGGTCYPLQSREDGYICRCPSGTDGRYCQLKSRCDVNPCKNGGTCRDAFWDRNQVYRCDCPENYDGKNCEIVRAIPCKSNPCQNGGSCYSHLHDGHPSGYYCQCPEMYYGTHCQHDKCPVERKRCWVPQRQVYSSDFDSCMKSLRNYNNEMRTCVRTRYEEVQNLQTCDCSTHSVGEHIRKMYIESSDEDVRSCIDKTSDDEWALCSEKAMSCVRLYQKAFQGAHGGCNETTKQELWACIERYEDGTLDLSSCPAGKAVMKIAQSYKFYVPIACEGHFQECAHWEQGHYCQVIGAGEANLDYMCSIHDKEEDIKQCFLRAVENSPRCRSLRDVSDGLLRSLLNRLKVEHRDACAELANYKKMRTGDWGCLKQD